MEQRKGKGIWGDGMEGGKRTGNNGRRKEEREGGREEEMKEGVKGRKGRRKERIKGSGKEKGKRKRKGKIKWKEKERQAKNKKGWKGRMHKWTKVAKAFKDILPLILSLHRPSSFAERTFLHSSEHWQVSLAVHVRWVPGPHVYHLLLGSAQR